MANLQTSMNAAFWDFNIATPQTLDSNARAIPGDPLPLELSRASKAMRVQQLVLLSKGFPYGLLPSYAPSSNKEPGVGGLALQSLFCCPLTRHWCLGLIGQFRPKNLLYALGAGIHKADWKKVDRHKAASVAKQFFEKSLSSIGLCSQHWLGSTSLHVSSEKHGEKKRRSKTILMRKLDEHDITLEAAWPELFVDHNGKYWDVPESISFDCSSVLYDSGFRYRFGFHKNGGHPEAADSVNGETPSSLMPGSCAKAALSYEKSRDFWRLEKNKVREWERLEHEVLEYMGRGYDVRLSEPHASISGIIGGTCEAWFGERGNSVEPTDASSSLFMGAKSRLPPVRRVDADLFGSVCYTYQQGEFRKLHRDLTRVDARLDITSATALAKGVCNIFRNSQNNNGENLLAAPRLSLIFQQQVAGPIVFRLDSKFSLGSSGKRRGPHMEDVMCSLNYSLRALNSGKVVAWYSPKRNEAMIELRVFEF